MLFNSIIICLVGICSLDNRVVFLSFEKVCSIVYRLLGVAFNMRLMRDFSASRWKLTGNGCYLVKSFYIFLQNGGLRYPVAKFFCRSCCPRKVLLFNWLVWKNRVPSLANLEKRRCNKLPTVTCVLCHAGIETMDHLFLHCSFVRPIWEFFF